VSVLPTAQLGWWGAQLDLLPFTQSAALARHAEQAGFGVVWIPESVGREVMSHAALLLERTERATIASGIANIWARDPMAMANGARTLAEAHPDRFLLGIGVSHGLLVEARGSDYVRPLDHMRRYLEDMLKVGSRAPEPSAPAPLVLGALGPRMLQLAAERTAGAHTYCVTVPHTRAARATLGPSAWLAVHQAVVMTEEDDEALAVARAHLERYLPLPNYRNNLRRLGWEESDLDGGGSEALVRALIVWGRADVEERLAAHLEAGADHVAVQILQSSPDPEPLLAGLEQIGATAPLYARGQPAR
jgi:probable F420-dependent oxidoreductase